MKITSCLHHYNLSDKNSNHWDYSQGCQREIDHKGRRGVEILSMHGTLALPQHSLNESRGTLTMWVMPLDDLHSCTQHGHHAISNPFFNKYVFLSDREALADVEAANFVFFYHTYCHPMFMAKFAHSTVFHAIFGERRNALANANYFFFRRLTWYQLALRWDREAGHYEIFVNGVKVGAEDQSSGFLPADRCGPVLHLGCPRFAFSDVKFYGHALSDTSIAAVYASECVSPEPEVDAELRRVFAGEQLAHLSFQPDTAWQQMLALSLRDEADYAEFFLQGCATATAFTSEGLRITTPPLDDFFKNPSARGEKDRDMTRMYLWTREVFEGDIYFSIDFQPKGHGGLALVMWNAAGMQGEDFLREYPLRTNGAMAVVHREDVRNYHWEFFREMVDTRNDLVSHVALKNPWYRPIGFQVENRLWKLDHWYRLEVLQIGDRIRGAIDGKIIFDFTDSPADNNGPVFRHGRIALRCMMRTDILFRDFAVWVRSPFCTEPIAGERAT